MAFTLTDSDAGLLYEEHDRATGLRVLFGCAGIVSIVSSWVFVQIIRSMGEPTTAARVGGVVASIAGIAAFWGVGGYCLKLALFLPTQSVHFDGRRQMLVYRTRAPATGQRETEHRFDQISSTTVEQNPSEDGPMTFSIVVSLRAGRPIHIGVFAERAEALRALARIEAACGNNALF